MSADTLYCLWDFRMVKRDFRRINVLLENMKKNGAAFARIYIEQLHSFTSGAILPLDWNNTKNKGSNWFRLHTIQPITFRVLNVLVPWWESFLFDLMADGFFEKMKANYADIVIRYLWKTAKTLGWDGGIRRAGIWRGISIRSLNIQAQDSYKLCSFALSNVMIIARALEKCINVLNHSTIDCLRRAWIYPLHVIMIVIECAFILNNMFS